MPDQHANNNCGMCLCVEEECTQMFPLPISCTCRAFRRSRNTFAIDKPARDEGCIRSTLKMTPCSDCFIISFVDNTVWWITDFIVIHTLFSGGKDKDQGAYIICLSAFRVFVCVIKGIETALCEPLVAAGARLGHTGSVLFISHFSRLHQCCLSLTDPSLLSKHWSYAKISFFLSFFHINVIVI